MNDNALQQSPKKTLSTDLESNQMKIGRRGKPNKFEILGINLMFPAVILCS